MSALVCWLSLAGPLGAQAYNIRTVSGAGPVDGQASAAALAYPWDLAIDGADNVAVLTYNRVYRISAAGALSVLAGDGGSGCPLDGGPALESSHSNGRALAADASGRVYLGACGQVYRIDPANPVYRRIAGTGGVGPSGDGGPALQAAFGTLVALAVGPNGDVFVSDSSRIRRIRASDGLIERLAGTGVEGFAGDGGPALDARFWEPRGLAVAGNRLLIADTYNNRVRAVDLASLTVATIAGTGTAGSSGDGGPASSATLAFPEGVSSRAGVVFIQETGRVRRVDPSGVITRVAGGGSGGDGGPATSAQLAYCTAIGVRSNGDLVIGEYGGNKLRLVSAASGLISTLGGDGTSTGDGPAARALMLEPQRVALDGAGNAFVTERSGARVRRIDAVSGAITTIAGTGNQSYGGDGGPAAAAFLAYPDGIAVDASGNVFVADTHNNRVRRIDAATQVITTVAGDGTAGYAGDGGPGTLARLNHPAGLALGGSLLLIADRDNHRIRALNLQNGTISTLAGTGVQGSGGDGGPAVAAQLNGPMGVRAVGLVVLIADTGNNKLRGVSMLSLKIDTWPTNPTSTFGGLTDVTLDASGQSLVVVEQFGARLRTIRNDTYAVSTVAGTSQGFFGDGGFATQARLRYPIGVAFDPRGALWVADTQNNRVRKLYWQPVRGDLSGDRASDLLFRAPADGSVHLWAMNGASAAATLDVTPAPGADWRLAGVGDFNGDERNDLALWNAATGAVEFWLLNGTQRVGAPVPLSGAAPLPLNWLPVGVADFDRDGRPDLLWRNTTSQKLVAWTLAGTARKGSLLPNPDQAADANWRVVAAADANADGIADLVFQNSTSANVVIWLMDASFVRTSGNFTSPARPGDANWTLEAAADYGIGAGGVANSLDLVWRNTTSGNLVLWYMDLAGVRTSGTPTTPAQPAVASWQVAGPH